MFSKSLPLGIFGTFQEKRGKKRVERSAEASQKVVEELEEKLEEKLVEELEAKLVEELKANRENACGARAVLFCYISFSIQEHIW